LIAAAIACWIPPQQRRQRRLGRGHADAPLASSADARRALPRRARELGSASAARNQRIERCTLALARLADQQ